MLTLRVFRVFATPKSFLLYIFVTETKIMQSAYADVVAFTIYMVLYLCGHCDDSGSVMEGLHTLEGHGTKNILEECV